MKKRMIWCLLASLIVVSVLVAGCSKGGSSSTASSPSASTPSASTQSQSSGSQSIADLLNKFKQAQSMSLDYIVTTSGRTVNGTIWGQTGKMLKTESTINGMQYVSIMNFTDRTVISYQPASKRGTKIKMSTSMQPQSSSPEDYLNGVDQSKVQDLGTAVVNGYTCRVIQYPSADGLSTRKMWISEDLGFPIQITSTTATGKTTTIVYSNIKIGPLPSDTFNVPAGITIRDTTNMNLPPQQ